MKVLDLCCEHQHVFEGWFGSEDDYSNQLGRGLIQCPLCGNASITKRLSAPRLNLGSSRPETESRPDMTVQQQSQGQSQSLANEWLSLTRRILASTDDVGEKFAEEARKIHYGEASERSIRGKASADETQALMEEGIPVMPLYIPEALKGPLQ